MNDAALNRLPPNRIRRIAAVFGRNFLVWRKLIAASIFMNFGEPLIYLVGFGYGFGALIANVQGISYLTFVASGVAASATMMTASFESQYSVYARISMQQTHNSLSATPLLYSDIILGEILWAAAKGTLAGFAIVVAAIIMGALTWTALTMIPFLFLIGLCFASLGMIVTAFARGFDFFSFYFTLFITPMFILGGIFYPRDTFPVWLQHATSWIPLHHAVNLTRSIATDQSALSDQLPSLAILIAITFVAAILALHFMKRRYTD